MCVVGWKLFEELLIDRGEIYNSEVLLILYVLFVVTELVDRYTFQLSPCILLNTYIEASNRKQAKSIYIYIYRYRYIDIDIYR